MKAIVSHRFRNTVALIFSKFGGFVFCDFFFSFAHINKIWYMDARKGTLLQ